MELKTRLTDKGIEVEFSEAYTVRDFNAVQKIIETLQQLRADYQVCPTT